MKTRVFYISVTEEQGPYLTTDVHKIPVSYNKVYCTDKWIFRIKTRKEETYWLFIICSFSIVNKASVTSIWFMFSCEGAPRAFHCALCPGMGEFERCFGRVENLNRIYLLFWRNTPLSFFRFLQGLTDLQGIMPPLLVENFFQRFFKRKVCTVYDWRRHLSLRRVISILIGGAFERLFCPEGREFEQFNLQKFKCPGDCPDRKSVV